MATDENVLTAVREIIEHERGLQTNVRVSTVEIDEKIDVRSIRNDLGLTQSEFASLFGLPLATVQNWETGRRVPERAARLLLKLIAKRPDVVAESIRQ